mmetsp:Transcript_4731/g.10725  ORF Transcript_4731/g.10725 Transcript_4731/m.10725 type:complete len:401 (+) Transcript_4731:409-1611(+)
MLHQDTPISNANSVLNTSSLDENSGPNNYMPAARPPLSPLFFPSTSAQPPAALPPVNAPLISSPDQLSEQVMTPDPAANIESPTTSEDGQPKFYAVEAILVTSTLHLNTEQQPSAPVYDAILVPNIFSRSWWKKHLRLISIMSIVIIVAVSVTIGVLLFPKESDDTAIDSEKWKFSGPNQNSTTPTISGDEVVSVKHDSPPSRTPTSPPTQPEFGAIFVGALLETECVSCDVRAVMNRNGNTAVSDSDWIHLFSNVSGSVEQSSSLDFSWDKVHNVDSIAISDDVLVAGFPLEGCLEGYGCKGAVLVFEKDAAGTWGESEILVPGDVNNAHTSFGHEVAVDSDFIVVGARSVQSMYTYRRNGTTWVQEQKLSPVEANSNFGSACALKGGLLARISWIWEW